MFDLTQHYPNSFYLGGGVILAGGVCMIPVALLKKPPPKHGLSQLVKNTSLTLMATGFYGPGPKKG